MDKRDIRRLRLRQVIDQQFNGVDAAFAAHVGRSPSYIARLFMDSPEHRRNIGEKLARDIERACGLEPAWLDQAFESEPSGVREAPPSYVLEPIEVWDDESPIDEDEVELPFLKEIELSAGSGRTVIAESGKRKLRFGKHTIRSRGVDPANAVCVTVSGNSMEPVLRSGATVGVDRGMTKINDGDMYAIDHGGQMRVKMVYRMPNGGIRLRSFNRDEHPDEEYSAEEMKRHQIQIIGRVWWGAMFF